MSSIKSKQFCARANGFHGIRAHAPKGGEFVSTEISNFRIRRDGSLEKRYGYSPILSTSRPFRAHIVTRLEGVPVIFLLSDRTVYRFDIPTKALKTLGTIDSSEGNAMFFYHQGILYLMANKIIYILQENSLEKTSGYIPLIGKDWPSDRVGEPYEPMNLLHNQARISYLLTELPTIFLCAPYPILAIHKVVKNGVTLSPETDYYYDENFGTVNVLNPTEGDRITVTLSLDDGLDADRQDILSCTDSVSFGSFDTGRIYFWGSAEPTIMYCSAHVAGEEAILSSEQKVRLYFPKDHQFVVGDGRFPIRGATRYRDKLLIFTEGDTWMAEHTATGLDEIPTYGVTPTVGCVSPLGYLLAGNDPISVGRSTVYRWRADDWGSCEPIRMSEDIDHLIDSSLYDRAELCYHRAENELWLNDSKNATIWICCLSTGDWFRYVNVEADRLVELDGQMGFIKEGSIFAFDEANTSDTKSENVSYPIIARYRAALGDMGTEQMKSLSHMVFQGDADGEPLKVEFEGNDSTRRVSVKFNRSNGSGYTIERKRCPSGRFRFATLSFSSTWHARPLIHSLSIHTK